MKELVGKNKPFHSALDKAAQQIKRKVGTGAEFMQELMGKPGVKSSEIQDRGLNAIEHMPRMTLDQMKAELALRPVPAIQEKVLGEPIDQATLRKEINNFVRSQAKKYASEMSDTSREYRYLAGEEMRRLRNNPEVPSYVAKILAQDDQPHHERWTLPGGENYREMLIKSPKEAEQFPGVSGHFGGEPGILASLRLKDRTGPNGEKLLHLEELQSDWHQQGRERGYREGFDRNALKEEMKDIIRERAALVKEFTEYAAKNNDAISPEMQDRWNEFKAREEALEQRKKQIANAVPDAPFKKNWEEMALKRLVHHAAEKGYHGIVVTPGAEQADRYSLAKHIDKLEYTEGGALYAWDKNGNEVLRQKVPEDEVANYVGKDLADKLLSKEKGKWNSREITGANLVTGGEGMKAFYDKKVPNILNSIGKKHGVKTQLHGHRIDPWPENEMDRHSVENYKGPVQVHHFPITEPMRQDILKNGLPLYKEGGTIHKAVGGAVQPTIPQMKMQLLRSNPAGIQSLGANEAPDMSPKTYVPPDKQTGKFIPPGGAKLPAGGVDMNSQQPGQQLMPQQPMQQPTNQQPQAPQGMQPQGQQDQGGNILQMTPQGQTMAALGGGQQPQQPQQPQGLAEGGSANSKLGKFLQDKFAPIAIKASEALGKHEGKHLKVTQSDRTKVGGGFLGGPGFSALQHVDPDYQNIAWGVNSPGAASKIINAAKEHPEGDVIWSTMIGSPTQHSSNQMVFNMLLKEFKKGIKAGKLKPETRQAINQILATEVDNEGKPIFGKRTDIAGKNFFESLNTFDKRRVMAELMGGVRVGGKKGQIFDYDKILKQTTEPELQGAPTHAIGPRLFTVSGERSVRPDLHPAFPHMVHGEDLGVLYHPVPKEVMLPEFHRAIEHGKGRKVGYMDLTRNTPSQFLSEEFLTHLQKHGHKKGGKISQDAMRCELTMKKGK